MKSFGVDSICLKYDITGSDFEGNEEDSNRMLKKVDLAYEKHDDPSGFRVLVMHESGLVEEKDSWDCKKGCYYRYFFGTIGSDGLMYPCDYQTLAKCPTFGDTKGENLKAIWSKKEYEWEEKVIKNNTFKNVCPPFAQKINRFLHEIDQLKKDNGKEVVLSAINRVRNNYR